MASNQTIAARITTFEIVQGQPHLQGMQHLPMAAQPAGVALGASQLLPWGAGAFGAQPSQGLPDLSQAAVASATIKANTRLAAELWWSLAGIKCFLAHGSFSVVEELSSDLLSIILKRIVGVSVACTKQLQGLSEFAVKGFFHPAPVGDTPLAMPAEVHFRTSITTFMAVLEHGRGSAPELCKLRVANLRKALEAVLGLSLIHI